MKICIVTSSFPRFEGDYSGFFVYEQALALSKKHEVHVIALGVNSNFAKDKPFIIHSIPYPFRTYPLAQVKGPDLINTPLLLVRMGQKIHEVNKRYSIDLFYAFWTIPSAFITSLTCGNKPLLVGLMGSDLKVFGKVPLIKPFIKHALKRADKIVAVSNDLKCEATELGACQDDISVIPTGVDIAKFKPGDKRSLRQKLKIPDGFVWLFSGSLFKLKRVDWILEIARSLHPKYDFSVLILGDGPERESLERLKAKFGLTNVEFRGRVPRDEMPDYVAASDVLLLLSETEGLPNCVEEAMACGVPVIATNVGGLSDVVHHGLTGYLVDNQTQTEEYLIKLITSKERQAELGANALDFAQKTLSNQLVFDKIVKLCEMNITHT